MLSEIERFVNWMRRRNPEARTWRDYGYDLRQFANSVKYSHPDKVKLQDIDRFICEQQNRGFKATTINRRLAAILSFYAFLADENPSLVCPILMHRHHLREPQHLPRPVQEEDLRSFFACINDSRDKAMFTLMLRCGLRISEVASLRLADLYLSETNPRLLVHGKGSRERSVYLSPQSEHILQMYLYERPKVGCDFVFLGYQKHGMSTTAIHKRLMRYRTQANVYLTAHRLRHSFANDLLCADVPVTTIQKLLGHRWLETTQIYVSANDRQVQADYYAACLKIEGWLL
jgi:site-specific recombinase XerD